MVWLHVTKQDWRQRLWDISVGHKADRREQSGQRTAGLGAGRSIPAGRVTRSLLEIGGAPVRARPAQDSPAIVDVEVEGLTIAVHVIAALTPPIGHVPRATVESGRSYAPAPEVPPRAHGDVLAAVWRDEHAQA